MQDLLVASAVPSRSRESDVMVKEGWIGARLVCDDLVGARLTFSPIALYRLGSFFVGGRLLLQMVSNLIRSVDTVSIVK
jgi:hypothetical protein